VLADPSSGKLLVKKANQAPENNVLNVTISSRNRDPGPRV
jgi:hypothetical protein